MGGFLEDLGRTNTLSSQANTLLGNAINIRQMQSQEARDASAQAIDLKRLSMDEKAAGEMSAARIEEQRIRKAQEERAAKSFAFEQGQKEREQQLATEAAERTVDITVNPMFLSLPEEQRKGVLEFYAANGYTDPTGKGKARLVREGTAQLEGNPALFKQFMGPVIEGKKQTVVQAFDALQKAKETGDEKKIAEANALYKRASENYLASTDGYTKHLETLAQNEATETRAAATQKAITDRQITVEQERQKFDEKQLAETIRHNKAVEAKPGGVGGGRGGSSGTAMTKNIEYLVANGWDRADATKLVTQSKPPSREKFIADMTGRIYANPMIADEDKAAAVANAARFYDGEIRERGPAPKDAPPAGAVKGTYQQYVEAHNAIAKKYASDPQTRDAKLAALKAKAVAAGVAK